MKFKLLYFGEIFTNPKRRTKHISDIRMQFHPQLKKLVEHSPWLNLKKYMYPNVSKNLTSSKFICGTYWNPIITPKLKLIAELDIQMLHPEIVGVARSDIDNRVKTLLDGLRCPQTEKEVSEEMYNYKEPVFTLLDDDHLVTKISVNTSHLLSNEIFKNKSLSSDSIFMLINVNVRVSEGNLENLPFMI